MKKLLMSEYSAGFSCYSYILVNYLINCDGIDNIIYLTPEDNLYFESIDLRVDKRDIFKKYHVGNIFKRKSILWGIDRIFISVMNCFIRNIVIRKEKPDVVLVQASHSCLDGFFLKGINKKINKMLTVHDVIVPTNSLSWSMKSLKRMYDEADTLIVHSKTNKKQLMELFDVDEKKIYVIPHGLLTGYQKMDKGECRKRLGIETKKKVLLFYGDMRKSKGLDVLLKSAKGVDCHLLISGTPPYGESFAPYEELIEKNKLSVTKILEFTPDYFRDILFQASDFLVLPYKEFYSQSGVFMQAIQYGLPIIATDVSSFREYIEKYNIGYVAKPNDVDDLKRTINKACSENCDFNDGMKKAVEENCWEVTSEQYARLICGNLNK